MRLLVDDLRSFVNTEDSVTARSSAAAIQWLENHRGLIVDELWLDGVLDGFDSGQRVADWLVENGWPIRKIIVHSTHPIADKIVTTLEAGGYDVGRYKEDILRDETFVWIPPDHAEFDKGVEVGV